MWKEELRPAASLENSGLRLRLDLQKFLGSMKALARVRKGERTRPVPAASLREEPWLCCLTGSVLSSLVFPVVNVTCSEAKGSFNLKCWAFNFCLGNTSLTWYHSGEQMSQDKQQSEDVLLYGNGTYQSWVTIRVPQGEEQRFTWYVEHSGKHSTYTVSCGEPGVSLQGFLLEWDQRWARARGEGLRPLVPCI
jgi:hypothetical protein